MTKRRLPLPLLVIVLLTVAGCDSDQRAEGDQQRAGGTIRADRSFGPAELLAYRMREGDQLLEVLVGLSQSDRVVRAAHRSDNTSVRLRVTLDRGGEQDLTPKCVAFRLDEPLAGRAVINSATGRRIGQATRGTEEAAVLRRTCARHHPASKTTRP